MAQITKNQVSAINAMCKNGFRLDLTNFKERGQKTLGKTIFLVPDKKAVKLSLDWTAEIVNTKNSNQITMPRSTGKVLPQLHYAVYRRPDPAGCWISSGLGKFHEFTERPSDKRLMKALCNITELVTDDLVRSMLSESEREAYDASIPKDAK